MKSTKPVLSNTSANTTIRPGTQEDPGGRNSTSNFDSSGVADAAVLSINSEIDEAKTCIDSISKRSEIDRRISIVRTQGDIAIREVYLRAVAKMRGLDLDAADWYAHYVKDSTAKSYASSWKAYIDYCRKTLKCVESSTTLVHFIAHLASLKKLKADTIRTMVVGISSTSSPDTITERPIGQGYDVDGILQAFKTHGLKRVKDNNMWDLEEALKKIADNPDHELRLTRARTLFLLAIATFWRPGSDMQKISRKSVLFKGKEEVTFTAIDVKEGGNKTTTLLAYKEDWRVCPVYWLNFYMKLTQGDRAAIEDDALFTSHDGYTALSADTLRKIIREFMTQLQIPTKYTAHSTRAVSSSTYLMNGMPLQDWSSASTFVKHYKRDLVVQQADSTNEIKAKLPQQHFADLPSYDGVIILEDYRENRVVCQQGGYPSFEY